MLSDKYRQSEFEGRFEIKILTLLVPGLVLLLEDRLDRLVPDRLPDLCHHRGTLLCHHRALRRETLHGLRLSHLDLRHVPGRVRRLCSS